jgi:hypothetical protein
MQFPSNERVVHNNKVQLVNIRQNVGSYEIYKRHVFFPFYLGFNFGNLATEKKERRPRYKGFFNGKDRHKLPHYEEIKF